MERNLPGTPDERLILRARTLPKVRVQNGLMRAGDREIALSMMYMEDSDRGFFFSLLPPAKAQRIREELDLQKRLKVTYDQYKKAISTLTERLGSDRGGESIKSYIRPVR